MDITAYIESGIIEECVLGLASPEDKARLDQLLLEYPEIAAEKEAIEDAIGLLAKSEARSPRPELKDKIIQAALSEVPAHEGPKPLHVAKETESSPDEDPKVRSFNPWPLATIAASIALLVSLFFNFRQSTQVKQLAQVNTEYQEQLELLEYNIQQASYELEQQREMLDFIETNSSRQIPLFSAVDGQDYFGKVQWEEESGKVLLGIRDLPNPDNKHFVLWAIPDGGAPQNISASVPIEGEKFISWMETAGEAVAFGITLEESPDVEAPNLAELKVIGNV